MEVNKENLPNTPFCFSDEKFTLELLYQNLKMKPKDIYARLQQYLLSSTELMNNKFPVPGMTTDTDVNSKGFVERKCFKCLRTFEVTLDGHYMTEETCFYHPQRKWVVTADRIRVHPCCNRLFRSRGCSTFPQHVCNDPIHPQTYFKVIGGKSDQHWRFYSLDCEMIYTNLGQEVAKISLVDVEGSTVLDSYVQPLHDVVDYCSQFSGITPDNLRGVTTTLRDIQDFLNEFLDQNCILIGHGLNNDLAALKLYHSKIVDTSVLFPRDDGTKQKLKDLAREHLNIIIQNDPSGHNCAEDARACMALVLNKIRIDNISAQITRNDIGIPSLMPLNQDIHFGQYNETNLPIQLLFEILQPWMLN